jgi:hypothetical protein
LYSVIITVKIFTCFLNKIDEISIKEELFLNREVAPKEWWGMKTKRRQKGSLQGIRKESRKE